MQEVVLGRGNAMYWHGAEELMMIDVSRGFCDPGKGAVTATSSPTDSACCLQVPSTAGTPSCPAFLPALIIVLFSLTDWRHRVKTIRNITPKHPTHWIMLYLLINSANSPTHLQRQYIIDRQAGHPPSSPRTPPAATPAPPRSQNFIPEPAGGASRPRSHFPGVQLLLIQSQLIQLQLIQSQFPFQSQADRPLGERTAETRPSCALTPAWTEVKCPLHRGQILPPRPIPARARHHRDREGAILFVLHPI